MLSHSVLSFRTCYSLLWLRDTYVMVSSSERCSIYTVGFRNFCSSVLFRNVPFFVLDLLLLCVSLSLISKLPELCSFGFSFHTCSVLSIRLSSSQKSPSEKHQRGILSMMFSRFWRCFCFGRGSDVSSMFWTSVVQVDDV